MPEHGKAKASATGSSCILILMAVEINLPSLLFSPENWIWAVHTEAQSNSGLRGTFGEVIGSVLANALEYVKIELQYMYFGLTLKKDSSQILQ